MVRRNRKVKGGCLCCGGSYEDGCQCQGGCVDCIGGCAECSGGFLGGCSGCIGGCALCQGMSKEEKRYFNLGKELRKVVDSASPNDRKALGKMIKELLKN